MNLNNFITAQNTASSSSPLPPNKKNAENIKTSTTPSYYNSIQFVVNDIQNTSLNNIINSELPASKGSLFYRLAKSTHHHYNSAVGRSYSLNLRNNPPLIFHRDI